MSSRSKERIHSILAAGHPDLVTHFRALALAIPDKVALTYLARGEEEEGSITFAGIDAHARSLAAWFQHRGAQGERALMLFEAGVESLHAFLGCAYGRVIAVPMPVPLSGNVDRYLSRVRNVVIDGGIRYVLTTSALLEKLRHVAGRMEGLDRVEWLAVDELRDGPERWVEPKVDESDLTYLQYTSGSTAAPKGVMITHRNLMKIIAYNGDIFGYATHGTQGVCWMPYFHDFGLIEGLLMPLAHGMSVYLMSPFSFVQDPVRWLNAIHRYRASHSSGPNFAFDLCVRKTTPEQRARLDLSCWRRANIAAEPIRSATVDRFLETFAPHGFAPEALSPGWGLAEATLVVTAAESGTRYYELDAAKLEKHCVEPRVANKPSRTMVGCGRVWKGPWKVDVKIVDPETFEITPRGQIGEIWVSGDLVAQGYWNRPVETEATFHARIKGLPDDLYLRTGDLGFMDGDELVFTGRRKDLIIVEGRNHYPQEIEKTAESSHPCLRSGCSIAFSVDTDEQEQVVLVCELSKGYSLTDDATTSDLDTITVSRKDVQRAVRRGVAEEHQLRVHDVVFLAPGLIAKTTSGKLQRSSCKSRYLNGTLHQATA